MSKRDFLKSGFLYLLHICICRGRGGRVRLSLSVFLAPRFYNSRFSPPSFLPIVCGPLPSELLTHYGLREAGLPEYGLSLTSCVVLGNHYLVFRWY